VRFNGELYSYYKRLIAIRRNNPALSRGSFETLFAQGGVFLFARRLAGHPAIYVIFNRDEFSNSLPTHILPVGASFDEMIGGETVFASEGLVLPAHSVRILMAR
jgi:glycosidase